MSFFDDNRAQPAEVRHMKHHRPCITLLLFSGGDASLASSVIGVVRPVGGLITAAGRPCDLMAVDKSK